MAHAACPAAAGDYVEPTFLLLATQLDYDAATRERATTVRKRDAIIETLIREAIRSIEPLHRRMETDIQGSRAFLFSFCQLCDPLPCTRPRQLPCRHPDRVRPSLEALGFDLGRTADELLQTPLRWSRDEALPEYNTLVTAQLMNRADAEQQFSAIFARQK